MLNPTRPRRLSTVYECAECEILDLGTQRCPDCGSFMAILWLGGLCPTWNEPVAFDKLLAT